RGFAQSVEGKEEVTAKEIAEAFENGTRVAYKAIMKPIEGTILTVIRESSWYAHHDFKENPKITVEEYFKNLSSYMAESLKNTPELLSVLKEAGVVDSGGAGLCRIIDGFNLYLEGKPVTASPVTVELAHGVQSAFENEEFGYCTEFIMRLGDKYAKNFDDNRLRNKLAEMGESLVVVKDEDLIKVHVHTLHPGDVLNLGQRYGEFIKLKIENMQEQHSELIKAEDLPAPVREKKEIGIIAVASGEGVTRLLKELGVDEVISGGQTMNPSTEDFLKMIKELDHCEKIMLFPNNGNIMLAARQAAEMTDHKKVEVVNCTSIQGCISALALYDDRDSFESNLKTFNDTAASVTEIDVTYAVKDSTFDGAEVKEGDYMAMARKSIIASGTDLINVVCEALVKVIDEDTGLVTIITGQDAKEEDNEALVKYIENNTNAETELIEGDVPVYYYLIGVE
ncbi:MAG: DAK2 domain-containing protein, partial [Erysipelotrichaceae bacterium]|nr:DAK2 domain-containing protein [Erysipelotrichaceae bacterium]